MRELHEMLEIQKDECMIWENAFHVSFAESSEEGSDTKSIQETEQALPKDRKGWKRSETQSIEIKVLKKVISECSACDMWEQSLSECWCIFEKLKLERMMLIAFCVRKAKKMMKNNEQMTAKVQEIWWKMNEEALLELILKFLASEGNLMCSVQTTNFVEHWYKGESQRYQKKISDCISPSILV